MRFSIITPSFRSSAWLKLCLASVADQRVAVEHIVQDAATFFEQHPEIDVVFGDVVMVDSHGQYLYHRKVQTPLKYHTWICQLSTLSCAMFFRRRLVFDQGLFFEPRWRDVGDGEWMIRLLQRRTKMAALGKFTSA